MLLGCLQLIVLGELHIQPLNHSVLFLKETDIVFISDKWRLALDLDLNTYYDVLSTICSDLLVVEQRKKEFTPIHELKQISLRLKLWNPNYSLLVNFCLDYTIGVL